MNCSKYVTIETVKAIPENVVNRLSTGKVYSQREEIGRARENYQNETIRLPLFPNYTMT